MFTFYSVVIMAEPL